MFQNVKKGDIVDIVLPATSCSKSEIQDIKNYVKNELGLVPRIEFEDTLILNSGDTQNEFPNNNPEQRFLQLQKALKNTDSKIIWCARGGYSSGDLLPLLSSMDKVRQDKLFIGFSDIVSVSSFLQDEWDWNIICAPVLLQLARGEIKKDSVNELKELIFGNKKEFIYELEYLNEVANQDEELQIFSQICGGCVSVLAGHFGGNYQINFEDKILFLEDEGEDGERLDRYFRQIIEVVTKQLKLPSAILLGNFSQANPHGTPKAKNIQIAIDNFVKRIADFNLQIPVFGCKDMNIGHSDKMRPLILGIDSKITKHAGEFKLISTIDAHS
jgi:muramoyltetrapeptide carboxypeptidase